MVFEDIELKCSECHGLKASKPSRPPNSVVARGRHRGKTPNANVAPGKTG